MLAKLCPRTYCLLCLRTYVRICSRTATFPCFHEHIFAQNFVLNCYSRTHFLEDTFAKLFREHICRMFCFSNMFVKILFTENKNKCENIFAKNKIQNLTVQHSTPKHCYYERTCILWHSFVWPCPLRASCRLFGCS